MGIDLTPQRLPHLEGEANRSGVLLHASHIVGLVAEQGAVVASQGVVVCQGSLLSPSPAPGSRRRVPLEANGWGKTPLKLPETYSLLWWKPWV